MENDTKEANNTKDNDLLITVDTLYKELEELETFFQMPRLYLSNFFQNLRAEVDLAVAKQSQLRVTEEIALKLNENYIAMIDKINVFEKACMTRSSKNIFNKAESEEAIQTIEFIKEKIKFLSIQDSGSEEESSKMDDLITEIEDLIYDETNRLERIIFLNKTMFFIEEKNSKLNDFFNKINYLTTAGKLIFITNEYFGKRGLSSISYQFRVEFLYNRLINETVKAIHLKKLLEQKCNDSQIEEFEFDDEFHYLEMSNRQIYHLHPKTFSGLTKLKSINLNSNLIKSIDENLFQGLVHLEKLNLLKNRIKNLAPNTFRGLISLKEIHLRENYLTSLDANLFSGLANLEVIYLFYNSIEYLDVNLFKGLTNLREIYLGGNRLHSIDARLFHGLKNLQEIYLSHNQIESFDGNLLEGLEKLQALMLNNNILRTINSDLLSGLTKLEKLWLNDNLIGDLDANVFKNLENVKIIYLYNNNLKKSQMNRKFFNLNGNDNVTIYFD